MSHAIIIMIIIIKCRFTSVIMTTRVVVYGVGPIGQLIARVAFNRGGLDVVGAIDIDPQKVGKDLGEVIGLGKTLGIKVEDDADKVLRDTKPDIVLHSTGSFFDKVYPQIMKAISWC